MTRAAGRVPDFFVVGHAKSGTTALHAMLSQHPQIFLGLKEPRFFAAELRERDMPRPNATPRDLGEYEAWFAGAAPEQLVGDVSPDYLWSHEAARLIAEVQPDARIVAILREPASFLHSLHRQWLRHYVEVEGDFRKALELEQPRLQGRELPQDTYWPKALFYSDHVRYVEQLRRYHEQFGRERVLVLIYEDYRADNERTLRTVLRFLDVREDVPIRALQSNQSVHVQSPRIHGLLRKLTVAEGRGFGALNKSLKTLTPMRLRQSALQTVRKRVVFGEPEPPEEAFMLELRRRLRPEVVALGEYLGRDDLPSLWGYDELGD
ncbi:MAG TPA: sulfotransferase [Solirubrobacteraceae bacterium]